MGSPPPMRGKAPSGSLAVLRCRITPAYAGKRAKKSATQSAGQDHPRLCGEKWHIGHSITRQKGSPPPMRGKDLAFDKSVPADRITPAYAGKSWMHFMIFFFTRDHPRLCGEKSDQRINIKIHRRITPAYAGKSGRGSQKSASREDHPRLCGEKRTIKESSVLVPGSPPPMRGKVAGEHINEIRAGITPAYAGKRLYAGTKRKGKKDHPRLCGEK